MHGNGITCKKPKKIMKKNDLIEMLVENGVEMDENGNLTTTKKNALNLLWELPIDVNGEIDKENNVLNIKHKNVNLHIDIKTKKTRNTLTGGHGHKTRNDGYIIEIKMKNGKPETKTDLCTCSEIKLFIKELNKKNVEYMHIYDTLKNECRKSAWIDKTEKSETK